MWWLQRCLNSGLALRKLLVWGRLQGPQRTLIGRMETNRVGGRQSWEQAAGLCTEVGRRFTYGKAVTMETQERGSGLIFFILFTETHYTLHCNDYREKVPIDVACPHTGCLGKVSRLCGHSGKCRASWSWEELPEAVSHLPPGLREAGMEQSIAISFWVWMQTKNLAAIQGGSLPDSRPGLHHRPLWLCWHLPVS